MSDIIGYVNKLESFGAVDGPGVRYIIFLNGCRMRCAFCHNPETWKEGEGQQFTAKELLKKALRFKPYWKNGGGITVSGGEPLLQIDFLLDLFKQAKDEGVTTCIDTAGEPFTHDEPFYSKWKEFQVPHLRNYLKVRPGEIKNNLKTSFHLSEKDWEHYVELSKSYQPERTK